MYINQLNSTHNFKLLIKQYAVHQQKSILNFFGCLFSGTASLADTEDIKSNLGY